MNELAVLSTWGPISVEENYELDFHLPLVAFITRRIFFSFDEHWHYRMKQFLNCSRAVVIMLLSLILQKIVDKCGKWTTIAFTIRFWRLLQLLCHDYNCGFKLLFKTFKWTTQPGFWSTNLHHLKAASIYICDCWFLTPLSLTEYKTFPFIFFSYRLPLNLGSHFSFLQFQTLVSSFWALTPSLPLW